MDEFVGRFMAFKGEDEYVPETKVLMELTEVSKGDVELAFDAPVPGKPRVYISVSLAELCDRVARWGDKP